MLLFFMSPFHPVKYSIRCCCGWPSSSESSPACNRQRGPTPGSEPAGISDRPSRCSQLQQHLQPGVSELQELMRKFHPTSPGLLPHWLSVTCQASFHSRSRLRWKRTPHFAPNSQRQTSSYSRTHSRTLFKMATQRSNLDLAKDIDS